MKYLKQSSLLGGLLICVLTGVLTVLLCLRNDCVAYNQVSTIGGCDRYGHCGITFKDGTVGQVVRPAIGQNVCVRTKTRFFWQ